MFDFFWETNEMRDLKMGSRNRDLSDPSKLLNPYRNVLYSPIAELTSNVEERLDVAHVAVLGYNQACVVHARTTRPMEVEWRLSQAGCVNGYPGRAMRKIRLQGKWLELRVSGKAAITRYLNQL